MDVARFYNIIQKDREERKGANFKGSFLDYLNILKENPNLAVLSHERIYKLIIEPEY